MFSFVLWCFGVCFSLRVVTVGVFGFVLWVCEVCVCALRFAFVLVVFKLMWLFFSWGGCFEGYIQID